MFNNIKKNVRKKLESKHQLIYLNKSGSPIYNDNTSEAEISVIGPIPIPIENNGTHQMWQWYPFMRHSYSNLIPKLLEHANRENIAKLVEEVTEHSTVNSLLLRPITQSSIPPLVRIHSCCATGDLFGSKRCDCGPQLQKAFEQINIENQGAIIYMAGHEGRGIGLWSKAVTYLLQDEGEDTYQANCSLGLPEDSRIFTDAAIVLKYFFNRRPIRLMTNNPMKKEQLEQNGQRVCDLFPIVEGVSESNIFYLNSKRNRGHLLPETLENFQ